MVAVLVMILVMAGLGATMMTGAKGTRKKTQKTLENLQRELALDAALVHGFHVLKSSPVDVNSPLSSLKSPEGSGMLHEIPYSYRLTPEPQSKTVRIDGIAGRSPGPELKGYAVAYLVLKEQEYRIQQQWFIRYFGRPKEFD